MSRFLVSAALPAIVITLTFALTGCQRLREHKWRGPGYGEEVNSLTRNLRPPSDERQMTGLDERARDIERNLGVR
jgi:hypothetical protein